MADVCNIDDVLVLRISLDGVMVSEAEGALYLLKFVPRDPVFPISGFNIEASPIYRNAKVTLPKIPNLGQEPMIAIGLNREASDLGLVFADLFEARPEGLI